LFAGCFRCFSPELSLSVSFRRGTSLCAADLFDAYFRQVRLKEELGDMSTDSERPNVLLIVTHDLGTRIGAYGESSVQTPALDGLASQGVLFTNHFATAPFCSPSRGSMITGLYPHANGLMGLVNLGWDLPKGNTTLASALGKSGYETFLFGLQHEVKNRSRLGFQHFDSSPGGSSCDNVASQVVDFLKSRNAAKAPFYARVGFGEVHRGGGGYEQYQSGDPASVKVPPYMRDTSGAREDLAGLHGAIRTMDAAMGRILQALDTTEAARNTICIFTTDHGIAYPGAKATCYDPGLRTALIMRWPGVFKAGMAYGEMLSNIDLFPTILEATAASASAGLQGRSFLPLLEDRPYEPRRLIFAEKNTQPNDAKRCVRTERYKYIKNYDKGPRLSLPVDIEISLTRRDMGDDHLAPRPSVELYDLQNDPWERKNIAGKSHYKKIEEKLAGELEQIMAATDDPLLSGEISRPPDEAEIIRKVAERWGRPTFSAGV
jgi:arylsulfatase A-like enzyme